MKLRIQGTEREIHEAMRLLLQQPEVTILDASRNYPNRHNSEFRRYLDIALLSEPDGGKEKGGNH